MIRALLLIFDPMSAWERVIELRRSVLSTVLMYALPLLVLTTVGELAGLVHWGKQRGEFGHSFSVPMNAAITYGVIQFVLSLVVLFVGAYLLKAIGETFHGRHSYNDAFTTVTYSLGPLFMMRVLHAIPQFDWWLPWMIGACLTLSVLYHGIPHVMKPDPAHALGLYFIGGLLLVILTGLTALIANLVLQQQIRLTTSLPLHYFLTNSVAS